jgi:hypothetical protein
MGRIPQWLRRWMSPMVYILKGKVSWLLLMDCILECHGGPAAKQLPAWKMLKL